MRSSSGSRDPSSKSGIEPDEPKALPAQQCRQYPAHNRGNAPTLGVRPRRSTKSPCLGQFMGQTTTFVFFTRRSETCPKFGEPNFIRVKFGSKPRRHRPSGFSLIAVEPCRAFFPLPCRRHAV